MSRVSLRFRGRRMERCANRCSPLRVQSCVRRVLEKNRFKLEGILRKYYRKDGQFIDARLYALVIDRAISPSVGYWFEIVTWYAQCEKKDHDEWPDGAWSIRSNAA